jgi:hypothetical protein
MFVGTNIGSPLRPDNFKKSCYFMRVSIKEMCNIKTYKCFWFLTMHFISISIIVTKQFSRIDSDKPHLSNPMVPEKGSKAAT